MAGSMNPTVATDLRILTSMTGSIAIRASKLESAPSLFSVSWVRSEAGRHARQAFSRGLAHTSATRYLKAAGGKDGMNVPPAVIDEDSELGRRYIAAMQLAGRYSYAGREWVIERVRRIIGGAVTDMVHNHHNYAWRERHGDRDLWVVRKGATPAFPGQRGFVGGSMGDDAVIIEGVDSPEAKASMYSRPSADSPARKWTHGCRAAA
jgi:tRNA-splicing ligase RtcB